MVFLALQPLLLVPRRMALVGVVLLVLMINLVGLTEGAGAEKPKCEALRVSGFDVNDWINTWVVFWKRNETCSSRWASTSADSNNNVQQQQRACFTKPLDALPWVRRVLERLPYFPRSNLDDPSSSTSSSSSSSSLLGYLLWSSDSTGGHWYISSRPDTPEGSLYAHSHEGKGKGKAQGKAQGKGKQGSVPPSGVWKVYNGSALVEVQARFTCVSSTYWVLVVGDLVVRAGPSIFVGLVVLLLCSAGYDILLTRRYERFREPSASASASPPNSKVPTPQQHKNVEAVGGAFHGLPDQLAETLAQQRQKPEQEQQR